MSQAARKAAGTLLLMRKEMQTKMAGKVPAWLRGGHGDEVRIYPIRLLLAGGFRLRTYRLLMSTQEQLFFKNIS